ncbi:2-phosphosulfolactate phosphatase [Anatilimnocola floriformis]|uniref:2-phosphosulfolactate phosphatase n=1 Tax=Anatilimnocola floriformis TaxID=2948575 RepID=UPI0020C24F4E|nr:2-phosphosulfolactate phosphatase [Anatilimnocola floriformis]
MDADQADFPIRFEWGEHGVDVLGSQCDVIVLVDVLSFSTCVDIATSRAAVVLPYTWNDERAERFAREQNALLATKDRRAAEGYSLSPQSLAQIPAGARLVLPSPNGATLSLRAARHAMTIAACLRNSSAVAEFVQQHGQTVAVIACGERWPDGNLRFAWEDLVGAGAVISQLSGNRSPEAQLAADAYQQAAGDLQQRLAACTSGRELIRRGFAADLEWAAALNASSSVPLLQDGCYRAAR